MKELEDSPNFPVLLRNFQTEFIGYVTTKSNVYDGFVKHVNSLMLPQQPMTDLCSGSGEQAISIFQKSNCFTQLILSDKYPNGALLNGDNISYLPTSKDVLKMQFKRGTYYTMFNAFHHFSNEDKLKIIEKIHQSGARIFFVEILEPRIFCFLKVLFITTAGTLFLTPFMRPFSFKRFFFTYIVPVNVITITYDGVVSVCKSLSVKDYQKLFSKHKSQVKVFRETEGVSPVVIIQSGI